MDFWRTISILNKRKWLILFSAIMSALLTYGATRLVGSKWQASVKFMASSTSPLAKMNAQPGAPTDDNGNPEPRDMQEAKDRARAYSDVVRSRNVILPAISLVKMTNPPDKFLDNITVEATSPTNYELQVIDASPARAEALANAIGDNFLMVYHQLQTKNAQHVVSLLDVQLQQADARFAIARSRYEAYCNKLRIVGNPDKNLETAISRLQNAHMREETLRNNLAEAQAMLDVRIHELPRIPKTLSTPNSPVLPSPIITSLEKDLAAAEMELRLIKNRYTDMNPAVKKAQKERDDIAQKLQDEKDNRISASLSMTNPTRVSAEQSIGKLQEDAAGFRAQIPAARASITRAETELNRLQGGNSTLQSLSQELERKNDFRTSVSARLSIARTALDSAQRQSPLVIMERATDFNPAVNMSSGRSRKLILLAMLCALIGVSGIIIALDSIDLRVRNVRQAEGMLPAKVIAAIPQPVQQLSYSAMARSTELDPQSLQSEAYRFLGLHLLNPNGPKVRSLMILSAKAEQGSTTTITNLAITLAQAGKRVVVVDANVRTAEIHQVFEIANDYGFTDMMQDPTPENIEKSLKPTSVPGLKVITSGFSPANPWELFRSDKLQYISAYLRDNYDFVLYDTPSALIFTDALNLAPVVDAAFLCVRALEPLTGTEQRLIDLLEEANVKVLGSVISHVPTSVVEGYHNYQHYYGPALINARTAAGKPVITIPVEAPAAPSIDLAGSNGHSSKNNGNGNRPA